MDLAKEYIKKKFKRRNKEIENAFNAGRRSFINEISKLEWNDNVDHISIAYTLLGYYMICKYKNSLALCFNNSIIKDDYIVSDTAKKAAGEHYKKELNAFVKDPKGYTAKRRSVQESWWNLQK